MLVHEVLAWWPQGGGVCVNFIQYIQAFLAFASCTKFLEATRYLGVHAVMFGYYTRAHSLSIL